jgi:hypothetical protein
MKSKIDLILLTFIFTVSVTTLLIINRIKTEELKTKHDIEVIYLESLLYLSNFDLKENVTD